MAQRPTADYPIDANTTSGTDLSLILNRFQTALESGNSGSSRPAYITAGGLWVKEGDPMELYLYDGTTDQLLYDTSNGINVTEGLWTLVDENNEAGQIQRPSDVLIDGNLTVTGEVVDGDGNPISIIDPATEEGVIATWNNTSGQWTPDNSVVVSGGNVGIGASASNEKLRVENSGEATFRLVTTSADGAANLYLNAGTKNWGIRNEASTRNFVIKDLTAAQDRLTIDSSGNATFSGTLSVAGTDGQTLTGGRIWLNRGAANYICAGSSTGQIVFQIGGDGIAYNVLSLQSNKDAIFEGGIFKNGGTEVLSTRDLIETLHALREATKDESTIEGLRDAIGDAIGGLIQKFEAMQAEAKEKLEEAYNQTGTQEITPDKGTKDDKPEAGTLDLEE